MPPSLKQRTQRVLSHVVGRVTGTPTVDAGHGQMTGVLSPWLEARRVQKAQEFIGDGLNMLDVGCGRVPLLDVIKPARYVGLDILDAVVDGNKARFPEHEFHVWDVQSRSVGELGQFDVIVMLAVLEHFPAPIQALRNLADGLSGHGRIILTTPHPSGERVLDWGAVVGVCSPEAEDEHQPLMCQSALRDAAREAGLVVLHYERFLARFNQLAVLGKPR